MVLTFTRHVFISMIDVIVIVNEVKYWFNNHRDIQQSWRPFSLNEMDLYGLASVTVTAEMLPISGCHIQIHNWTLPPSYVNRRLHASYGRDRIEKWRFLAKRRLIRKKRMEGVVLFLKLQYCYHKDVLVLWPVCKTKCNSFRILQALSGPPVKSTT